MTNYRLSELFAYRFYEKKDGPFVSLMHFDKSDIGKLGYEEGIVNISEIYENRKKLEKMLRRVFIRQGGKPCLEYPYYAAIYDKLPKTNQLHVRFKEPECIKIPMYAFKKTDVSFTYCQSPRAFTRKDNHPTRRKLFMWDEAEVILNKYPFLEIEDTWLEMQIWNDEVLKYYYYKGTNVRTFQVVERLSEKEKEDLVNTYNPYMKLIKAKLFFAPYSAHGIAHTARVMILTQKLGQKYCLNESLKRILLYCAIYHDIGRENHEVDEKHGYRSYQKAQKNNLLPFDLVGEEILKFIIENHPIDIEKATNNVKKYKLEDDKIAIYLLKIFKDADTLDRCRFGYVNRHHLCIKESSTLLHFAYQLLRIYREF